MCQWTRDTRSKIRVNTNEGGRFHLFSGGHPRPLVRNTFSALVVLADNQPEPLAYTGGNQLRGPARSDGDGESSERREYDSPLGIRTGAAIVCISKISVGRITDSIAVSIDTKSTGNRTMVRLHHPPFDNGHLDSGTIEYFGFDHDFTTLIDNDGTFTTVRGIVNRFLAGSTVGIISEGSAGMCKSDTLFRNSGGLLFSIIRHLTEYVRRPHRQLQLRVIDVNGCGVRDLIADRPRHLVFPGSLQQILARFEVEAVHAMDSTFLSWWQDVYARRNDKCMENDPTSQLIIVLATHFPAPNVMVLVDQAICKPRVKGTGVSTIRGALTNSNLEASHDFLKTLNDPFRREEPISPIGRLLSAFLPPDANTEVVVVFHLSALDYSSSRYLLLYKRDLERHSSARKRSLSHSTFAKAWRVMTPTDCVPLEGSRSVTADGARSERGYETD